MTPAARIAAAITILDSMQDGLAAEQALTRWARQSRYAGSKDRAAVRDHVFDVVRVQRLAQHLGGGTDGRATMIGLLRHIGTPPQTLFTGEGHAPDPLTDSEKAFQADAPSDAVRMNLPDWLVPVFQASLGAQALQTASALQERAPITLRVNARKATRDGVIAELSDAQVHAVENSLCDTALTITEGARKIRQLPAYTEGRVELQDAASQAVVAQIPDGTRCLDYCAGGGGKALGLAALPNRTVYAHDIDPGRMSDLPQRAERAGVTIAQHTTAELPDIAPFDIVLCDAPCSGSGAWRRAPAGKWALTPSRLDELTLIQDDILDKAASLTAQTGTLVFATCSVLADENENRIAAFLERHPGWRCVYQHRFDVDSEGDGFFTAHLTRA